MPDTTEGRWRSWERAAVRGAGRPCGRRFSPRPPDRVCVPFAGGFRCAVDRDFVDVDRDDVARAPEVERVRDESAAARRRVDACEAMVTSLVPTIHLSHTRNTETVTVVSNS